MSDLLKAKNMEQMEDAYDRFKERSPGDVQKIAKKKIEESARLKYLKHLDWVIMLLQQEAFSMGETRK